jgi:hypothetical protein
MIGLALEEKSDCTLPVMLVRDQGEDKNKKWMDLEKSVGRAAYITFMQQKAIYFLKEAAAKERTNVATPSVHSQQSTSSVVTVVAVATTPLMAGQIFWDFLISAHSKRLPIHESIKKL